MRHYKIVVNFGISTNRDFEQSFLRFAQGRAQGGAKGQSAPPEHLRGGQKGQK